MVFDKSGQDGLGELEPLDSYDSLEGDKSAKDEWQAAGLAAIKKGEVAACVLSGGAGTRLGFEFPKGMYDIGLPSGKTVFYLI
jgi:UDP-N-acetylglucosamine/UDP-N-acetylgalactosamine diphosphorylase